MRKVALGVSLLTFAAPTVSLGLGLGDIEVESALNQPLKAQIQVLSVPAKDLDGVKVRLAPRNAFARVGIERVPVLGELRFSVSTDSNGHPVINVTSTRPVKEPFLDFLVQVEWPKGQLLREYTILLDPPVVMSQPATTVIQAPMSARAPLSAPIASPPAGFSSSTGASLQGATAPPARQGTIETDFSRSWGAAGPAGAGQSLSYQVKKGDTLGDIAQQYRPDRGASLQQTMLAFLRKNPEAFSQGNVNNLKAGYILRVPDRNEVLGIGRAEAVSELARQTALWREYRQQLAQRLAQSGPELGETTGDNGGLDTTQGDADTKSAATAQGADDLEIMGAGTLGEGQGAASGADAEVREQLTLTKELIENQRQENAELQARVAELEKMLLQQDRIINLQSAQLAELQQALTQGNQGAGPQESAGGSAALVEQTPAQTAETSVADQPPEGAPGTDEMPAADQPLQVAASTEEVLAASGAVAASPDEGASAATSDAVGDTEPADTETAAGQASDEVVDPDQLVDEAFADMEGMDDAWVGDLATEDPGSVAAVQPPQPEEAPQPLAAEQTVAEPAAVPPVWASFIDEILANPTALAALGGTGALALILLGLVVARSRRKPADEAEGSEAIEEAQVPIEEDDAPAGAVADSEEAAAAEGPESAAAEAERVTEAVADEAPDEASTDKDGDDVIAEADVYIAYGMYGQAEELLQQALEEHPDSAEYRAKLLEAYHGAKKPEAFEVEARKLHEQGPSPEQWERVTAMGRELDPQNPLYQTGPAGQPQEAPAGETPAPEAGAAVAGVAAMATTVSEVESPEGDSEAIHVPQLERDVVAETAVEPPDPELEQALLTPDSGDDESETMLEFDVEDLDIGVEEGGEPVAEEVEAEADPTTLDFDLSDLSELDIEAPEGDSGTTEVEEDALEIDLEVNEEGDEADVVDLDDLVVDEEVPGGVRAEGPEGTATMPGGDEDESLPPANPLETLVVPEDAPVDRDGEGAGAQPQTDGDSEELAETLVVDMDALGEAPAEETLSTEADQDQEAEAAFLDELLSEDLGMEELDEDALLSTDDEVGTKLDLARAYMDMGDQEGARSTLEEVMQEGDDTQRKEAENLLRQIA